MISSNLGSGYALVPVPAETNPNEGGGPIRKSPLVALPAHAGNTVFRTPHAVVREAEPGARWPGDLSRMMFLPDGRLVPAKPYARDMFRGADTVQSGCTTSTVNALVRAGAFFAGGAIGYKSATKHKVWGTIGGAVIGGILGAIFG